MGTTKQLYRVNENKVFLGVSTGLSEYMNIDVNIIRVVFVILALTGVGFPILIYIILGIILPIKEIEIKKAETIEKENEYSYNEDDYKY